MSIYHIHAKIMKWKHSKKEAIDKEKSSKCHKV
jgi:hypothetical protein